MEKQTPNLIGVPETMLWTLHNRAYEALRQGGVIRDEFAVQIYQSLDYDYREHFGPADGSHGVRSAIFDAELEQFLSRFPDGIAVNLGEGLETQRFRIKSEQALWFSIDLKEAIEIRERFIQPDAQHVHLSLSALDESWMDKIPNDHPLYITAQGLFMYFTEQEVRNLLQTIGQRFPGAWLCFDHIPQ